MGNKEKILQLRQSVLSMREDMAVLREQLKYMLPGLEAERMLQEEEAIALGRQVEHLMLSEEAFLEECDALQLTNEDISLLSWEHVLEEQLKQSEKDVFRRVIDFVCRLRVSNAGMREYLEQLRGEVQSLDVDSMSKEELTEALGKYMSLEEAFFEADEKKRFMRVMPLSSSFNMEFLYCINSGELTLEGAAEEPSLKSAEEEAEEEPEATEPEAEIAAAKTETSEAQPSATVEAMEAAAETGVVEAAEPSEAEAAEPETETSEAQPLATVEAMEAAAETGVVETVETLEAEATEIETAQPEAEIAATKTEPSEAEAAEPEVVQEEAAEPETMQKEEAAEEELPVIELEPALLSQAMVSEGSLYFIEETSEKETTRFYAKTFHSEVCGSSERKKCLSKAFELHGVTPRLMANIMGKSELLFEGACSALFRNGYFRRYSISGYEPFYYLSKKGYEAFQNEETAVYLQAVRQQDDAAFCQHDSLSVLTWHYIEAAMNYIHEEPRAEGCTYEIVELQKNAFAIIFTYGEGLSEQRLMIAGIASDEEQDFRRLLGRVARHADTVKRYVVYGVHETQVQAAAGLLLQVVPDSAVAYTIGDSEICYDFMTGEAVDIFASEMAAEEAAIEENEETEETVIEENKENKENEENEEMGETATGEIAQAEEISTEDAQEVEETAIGENEETEETVIEGNGEAEIASALEDAEEEMDLEIPTISLDVQSEGDMASLNVQGEEGIASSVAQDVEDMASSDAQSEENAVSHEAVYCEMICDGHVYCATAYLKAAAIEEPAWQEEYRQLAYAVNDPMEQCRYTAQQMSEVYLTGSVNADYFVSALLRCLFFEHETDTQGIRQLYSSFGDAELFNRHSEIRNLMQTLMDYKDENQIGVGHYGVGTGVNKTVRDDVLAAMKRIMAALAADRDGKSLMQQAGSAILENTLLELTGRLEGSYPKYGNKYFYIGFLTGDAVLLDASFMPVLEMNSAAAFLPQLRATARIAAHSKGTALQKEPELLQTLKRHLEVIVRDGGDFSSANCIIKYIKEVHPEEADAINASYNPEIATAKAKKTAELQYNRFIGNLEMSPDYGGFGDKEKDSVQWIVDQWYGKTEETLNFGFFKKILKGFREKAQEDLLKPLQKENVVRSYEYNQVNDLREFWEVYEDIYTKVEQQGYTLQKLLERSGMYQPGTESQLLADNWLKNVGNAGEDRVKALMEALGFSVDTVSQQQGIDEKLENYLVMLKKPENRQRDRYSHPVSAFGSQAEKEGFSVVCLHGTQDSDSLVETFQEIGNARHCLILLDSALESMERRALARKAKQAANGRIYAVVDRVVLVYLMNHYKKATVNKMLMAVTMPFTACQPYVADFSKGMPQEVFIGRREELARIEAPDGVSLVYGGRHLGKSAMLRMARRDIDHNENHDRAVLVNVKGMNFRRAVKNVYKEMCREGILAEGKDVEEWNVLTALIEARLKQSEEYIPYLLLLLDEADALIKSCSTAGYAPIVELESLQSRYHGRFKFVMAGLKNVVRYEEITKARHDSELSKPEAMTVKPFKYEEARELLEVPLSYLGFGFPDKEQTEAMISTVFRTAGYFPGMLQLFCSMLLNPEDINQMYNERNIPPYEIREGHIKRILADAELHRRIKDEFRATLRVDDEEYYYIIALLIAACHHAYEHINGCGAEDVLALAQKYGVTRITALHAGQVDALMQEMQKLNVLQQDLQGRYRIAGYGFYRLLGTEEEIKNKLTQYAQ